MPMLKSLRISSQLAAALGILSITLTGEIAPVWLVVSWGAWGLGFFMVPRTNLEGRRRRIETAAVVAMVTFLILDFFIFRVSFFISIAHFLLLFQIVKLIGLKDRKDCFQIFLFSFLQILASCTLSVDAWHALVLLAMIPTATAALFWSQMTKDCDEARALEDVSSHTRFHRMAVGICLIALPLNIFLTTAVFVIFPRLTLNASLPGFGNEHAGYTNQVNLAQKGNIKQNTSVVLWMSFSKPEDRFRWDGFLRGEVLSEFDGRQWTVSKSVRTHEIWPDSNGVFTIEPIMPAGVLHESVTLADTSAETLFITGAPYRVMAPLPALSEGEGGTLRWAAPWRRPLHYEVISAPSMDSQVRKEHLALPSVPLERVAHLAQRIAGRGSPIEQARQIEQYLARNYRYSTDFGNHIASNPVDYFLFDHPQGACGHFASAMAIMLRLQKIPSRVVAGYYKGEWNAPAESIVIREQDAHAWVEAYIPGQGWTRFDPTPVSLESSVAKTNYLHLLQQYWDYLSLQWNRCVIQYDLYSQVRAYERIKGNSDRYGQALYSWWNKFQSSWTSAHSPQKIQTDHQQGEGANIPYLRIAAFFSLALGTVWLFAQKRLASGDPKTRFYSRFLERMARAGHPKALHETGWEFAQRLSELDPAVKGLAYQTTERYYQVRFDREHL
jgi:transglutaminase-like putative cysteine protease